jgi:hypothetical protein
VFVVKLAILLSSYKVLSALPFSKLKTTAEQLDRFP